ncbi:Uncharacterized protein Rs2_44549 [Raphanus sativus]|nr:Uncharacterized protein Rs2_44549 [Raphanus sativus]
MFLFLAFSSVPSSTVPGSWLLQSLRQDFNLGKARDFILVRACYCDSISASHLHGWVTKSSIRSSTTTSNSTISTMKLANKTDFADQKTSTSSFRTLFRSFLWLSSLQSSLIFGEPATRRSRHSGGPWIKDEAFS